MKELIIFNVILLAIYCFFAYSLLNESQKSMFFNEPIIRMILILILPLILCFLNQLFILFWGIDRIYVWYTFLYIIPPVIESVSSFIKNYNSEKFYKKNHDKVKDFVVYYLKKYDFIKDDISILVFLDTKSKKLGTHKIILKGLKFDNSLIEELKMALFYEFNLNFDIFVDNIKK